MKCPMILLMSLIGLIATLDDLVAEEKELRISSTDGKFSMVPPRQWNKHFATKQPDSIILARECTSAMHGSGGFKVGRYLFPNDIIIADLAKAVRDNDQAKLLDYKFISQEEKTISNRKSICLSYSYRVDANDAGKISCSSFLIQVNKREMITLTFSITELQFTSFKETFQKSALTIEIKE
jgi:hypothetical protein